MFKGEMVQTLLAGVEDWETGKVDIRSTVHIVSRTEGKFCTSAGNGLRTISLSCLTGSLLEDRNSPSSLSAASSAVPSQSSRILQQRAVVEFHHHLPGFSALAAMMAHTSSISSHTWPQAALI